MKEVAPSCSDSSKGEAQPEASSSAPSNDGPFGAAPPSTKKAAATVGAGFSFEGGHKKKEDSAGVGFSLGATSAMETAMEKKGGVSVPGF